MSKKHFLLFCMIVLTYSCKQKKRLGYEQQILGDWKLVKFQIEDVKGTKTKVLMTPGNSSDVDGFEFLPDNVCKNKEGYLTGMRGRPHWQTQTKYQINDSTLAILNLRDNIWEKSRIMAFTTDTLLTKEKSEFGGYTYYKYVRQHDHIKSKFDFDEIVASSYSAWGLRYNIILNKNGTITYCQHLTENNSYTSDNGSGRLANIFHMPILNRDVYFTSKISNEKVKELSDNFFKANVLKLKDNYQLEGGADGSEVSLAFIKDGKVIKTIHDLMGGAPPELKWAYNPLLYLDGQIKLDSAKESPFQFPYYTLRFRINDKVVDLNHSEVAYLLNLLRQAKPINTPFLKKYILAFFDPHRISQIGTDGRYYEITSGNGSKKTYDIGFNFIDRNRDVLKFANWSH